MINNFPCKCTNFFEQIRPCQFRAGNAQMAGINSLTEETQPMEKVKLFWLMLLLLLFVFLFVCLSGSEHCPPSPSITAGDSKILKISYYIHGMIFFIV